MASIRLPSLTDADLRKSLGAVLRDAKSENRLDEAVIELSRAFDAPLSVAPLLAIACGYLVESGAAAETLEEPLRIFIERLAHGATRFYDRCLATIPQDSEDEAESFEQARAQLAPSDTAGADAWTALSECYLAAIAVTSRSPEIRKSWKSTLQESMRRMSAFSSGAHWLDRMLAVLDDEPFVVIEPSSGRGICGRMTGISENFQLNVLLMDAFPRGLLEQPRISQRAVAVASGMAAQSDKESLVGCWNLYTWQGIRQASQPEAPRSPADNAQWIWNEGVPADIPVLAGQRVILLGPASYPRSWNSQRDFSALRASLLVERQLTSRESAEWQDRMVHASRVQR